MTDWQTMDTAPKDGTWILLTGGETNGDYTEPPCVVGQWTHHLNGREFDEGHWQFGWYDGGYLGWYNGPKRWMPVPAT